MVTSIFIQTWYWQMSYLDYQNTLLLANDINIKGFILEKSVLAF